jgi:hypothetical protein
MAATKTKVRSKVGVWDVVPSATLRCIKCHSPFLELVLTDPTGRVVYHYEPLACPRCATARELAEAVRKIYSWVKGSRDRARLVEKLFSYIGEKGL